MSIINKISIYLKTTFISIIFIFFTNSITLGNEDLNFYKFQNDFILKLVNYIIWPEEEKNIDICLVGNTEIKNLIFKHDNSKVNNKKINIHFFLEKQDLNKCNILYLGDSYNDDIEKLLASLSNSKILTISDIKGFSNKGGVIEIIARQSSAKILLNKAALQKTKLKLQPMLYSALDL